MSDMVERCARAIAEAAFAPSDIAWRAYIPYAQAVLRVLAEPDDAMIEAGEVVMRGYDDMRSARSVYAAMLSAAQGGRGEG